jgi:hypothetical protein
MKAGCHCEERSDEAICSGGLDLTHRPAVPPLQFGEGSFKPLQFTIQNSEFKIRFPRPGAGSVESAQRDSL